jgi:hypothetical protein
MMAGTKPEAIQNDISPQGSYDLSVWHIRGFDPLRGAGAAKSDDRLS